MPNSKDLVQSSTPSILVVGDGGTEKTRFLAGCPKPFVFDFDAGMLSTRGMDVTYETFKDAPFGSKAINKEAGIYPWGESWPRFIDYLNTQVWPRIEKGEWGFQTVGIDSLTTLGNQCMNYILKSSGKTGSSNPEQQHWGSYLRLLESVLEQLSAWPTRLVVTAHIKRDENLATGSKEFLPMIAGQAAGRIGIYFDECYYTDVKGAGKDRRVVFKTESEGLYKQAKSRHGVPSNTPAQWGAIAPFFEGGKMHQGEGPLKAGRML